MDRTKNLKRSLIEGEKDVSKSIKKRVVVTNTPKTLTSLSSLFRQHAELLNQQSDILFSLVGDLNVGNSPAGTDTSSGNEKDQPSIVLRKKEVERKDDHDGRIKSRQRSSSNE